MFFLTAETTFNYVYHYKDHLGNIRLGYTKEGNDLKITEENHYYTYGMKHSYNASIKEWSGSIETGNLQAILKPVDRSKYQYKYNGKEYQDELGLNMTAMDYRQYDNAIGRFGGMDALAEIMSSQSPYHFSYNNPAFFADPSGLMGIGNGNSPVDTMWNQTPWGTNSYWVNDGYGNFDNIRDIGFINKEGQYFAIEFDLDPVFVSRGGYFSRLGGIMQFHVYNNSPYYKYVRDKKSSDRWDEFQNDLDYIGLVPGLGEPADLANALISTVRGKYGDATLSAIATVPLIGWGASAIKLQKHHIIQKAVYKKMGDGLSGIMDLNGGSNLKKIPTPFHGNHPEYSKYVTDQINILKDADNLTPGSIQALQKNLNSIINHAYDNFKITGQNLNEYSRHFLNGN